MIKCSECGYENMDGLDYCDGCGAKLKPAAAAEVGTSTAATPPPQEPAPEAAGETAAAAEPEPNAPAAPEPGAPTAQAPNAATEAAALSAAPAAAPAAAPTAAPAAAAAPAATAPPFKARLVIVRGGRQGHEFLLEIGNNFVGRWDPETGSFPEVDMEADDPEAKISRKHALIRIENGKITVEDIGSLNGTYVNRQPRLQPGNPVELKSGDEIIVGKTFLKLMVELVS